MRGLRLLGLIALALIGGCDDGEEGDRGNPRPGQDGSAPLDFRVAQDDARADANAQDVGPPVCDEAERRCTGDTVEVCVSNGWIALSECPEGTICQAGDCAPKPCEPACDGLECGSDGCDGSCGDCVDGDLCVDGHCEPEPPRCGDDACDPTENCATCLADCACPEGESCDAESEACAACTPQCDGRECGDDGCGGECGACEAGVDCAQGLCDAPCNANCEGRICGDDGCDDVCGMCENGEICNRNGACEPPPMACGDDACDAGEDCANCPADCGSCCGDASCDGGVGENCATCPADCACPQGEQCNAERRECVGVCQPQCDGRNCGDDGCDGLCGQCDNNQDCLEGVCRDLCVPNCNGRECGDDGCEGVCGACDGGEVCNGGQCAGVCMPNCNGRECGDDGCDGICGACAADAMCTAAGRCEVPGALCDCNGDEVCLDGFCRAPAQLCSGENPIGLCMIGQDCLAGDCVNRGNACSPQNPTGVCPLNELCRDGACEAFDGEAICDDSNACTVDLFNGQANRCENRPAAADCTDGNGCTVNRCVDGVCTADPIPGCIEPPIIDPYVSPTNEGVLTLSGTKPAGSAIQINGDNAVPESPEERWELMFNLQPGENILRVKSVDMGQESAEVIVRVIYDIEPPTIRATPGGGVFLNPVGVTIAANEPARVYYTADGATPELWSKSFRSAKQFRIFHDTTLKFRALDDAGNWQEEITQLDFEISGYATHWSPAPALPEARTLGTAVLMDIDEILVAGGTDGLAPQAGVDIFNIATEEWSQGPALNIPRAQLSSARVRGRIYIIGGENDGLPLNLLQRLSGDRLSWENLAPMPSTRFGLAAVASSDRIYVLGGKTNGGMVLDVFEIYIPETDTWFNQVAQMPRPRFGHVAIAVPPKIYVIGGEDADGNPIAEVDVYDISTDEWAQIDDLPTPRSRSTVTRNWNLGEVGGGTYGLVVAGGRTVGDVPSAVVEEYDIDRHVWRERTPLDAPRHSAMAASGEHPGQADSLDLVGWVVGGQVAGEVSGDMTYYTREQDYLRMLPELPEGRFMAAAEEVDGLFYIFGGRSFQETTTVWAYDPETGRTVERAELPRLQNGLGSAVIDGLIYAVGGVNNFGIAVPWLHVYDPAEDTWNALQPMPTARSNAMVGTFQGKLWVLGGDNNGPLQTVEIYTPETDTWEAGPILPEGRSGGSLFIRETLSVAFGLGPNGPLNHVFQLDIDAGVWNQILNDCPECEPFEFGQAVRIHDRQLNIFGGRIGDMVTNTIFSQPIQGRSATPRIVTATNLLRPIDRAAVIYHLGRVYLLGGNNNAEPGPEGLTMVQQIDGHCFNGIRDEGETSIDTGHGCPQPLPPECRNYTVLSSNGRRIGDPQGDLCDRDLDLNRWYRLQGTGGTRFTERPTPSDRQCGTHATGYLASPHPGPGTGQTVRVNANYRLGRDLDWQIAGLRIRECYGYYIYSFNRQGSCNAAICTE